MLPQLWVCAAASRARGTPVIGFWKASVSIAATGFVCPMAISAARSVDAGDFRQSYTQKSSGQAEPFLLRVGEANGNFIKANSRFTKAIGCYQGRPTPKCSFYKQLPIRQGGGPTVAGGRPIQWLVESQWPFYQARWPLYQGQWPLYQGRIKQQWPLYQG